MPLRRDPSLIPLSHDHHHGLVRVLMIRQAVSGGDGLAEAAAATRAFFDSNLVPHFAAEEEALFTVLRRVGGVDDLIERLADEHRILRRMVAQLDASAPRLSAFADLLEAHIRCEERELFGRCQEILSDDARHQLEIDIRRILERPDDLAKACELPLARPAATSATPAGSKEP